jgi:CTP synthase
VELKRAGLAPDCLFLRADKQVERQAIDKLSVMCEVKKDFIFQVLTSDPMYRIFLDLDEQSVGKKIQEHFKLSVIKKPNISEWRHFIELIDQSTKTLTIGLVAKYVGSNDPYISVVEANKSAAYHLKYRVKIVVIEAESLEKGEQDDSNPAWKQLRELDGIVVPGGFDSRGIEGKVLTAQWARVHGLPYLGLCLGMQIMIIEAARSLLGLSDANSTEINPTTQNPVVFMMSEQKEVTSKGATMRLGSYPCMLIHGTRAYDAYQKDVVLERHRHRYEVNNSYRQVLEKAGFIFSGIYQEKNLVEIAELKDHPFMVGTQFHPEFQSSPLRVHPLFQAFMMAVVKRKGLC